MNVYYQLICNALLLTKKLVKKSLINNYFKLYIDYYKYLSNINQNFR